jgi:hypothetical protein
MSGREILNRAHFDPVERAFTFQQIQDVTDIMDRNKALQNESADHKVTWRHHACVPNVVITKWLQEEWARGNASLRFLGPGFDEWYQKKLDDPDNRAWRTDNPSNPFYLGWRK